MSYVVVASLLRSQSIWAVLMWLYSIATKYNGPLEAVHAHIDYDRYDMVEWEQTSSSNWTSQMSYVVVASLLRSQSIWAVLMCLYSIATKYNGPLEAVHAHIDYDSYDMVEWEQTSSSNWTSQMSYVVIASLLRTQSIWAVLMWFYSIATEYNGPLEATLAHMKSIETMTAWNVFLRWGQSALDISYLISLLSGHLCFVLEAAVAIAVLDFFY